MAHPRIFVVSALLTLIGCSTAPTGAPARTPTGESEVQRRMYRERNTRWSISANVGGGRQEVDFGGLKDRTGVVVTRIAGQYGFGRRAAFGVGASLQVASTDDDLFEGRAFDAGGGPRPADAYYDEFDFFPHFFVQPVQSWRFEMPVRIGLMHRFNYVDLDRVGAEYSWFTIGPRLQVDPELVLAGNKRRSLSLYGSGAIGAGETFVNEDVRFGPDEDYDSDGWGLRWSAGLRGRFGKGEFHAGFVWDQFDVGTSDFEGGRRVGSLDTERWSVEIGGGVRF